MAALKKERIKDQMLRTAARLWDIPEQELDANFDPLVALMIEACAAELEHIGSQVSESHNRLVAKLADMLVPETLTGCLPASAVMQAQPTEASCLLTPQHVFQTTMVKPESVDGNQQQFTIDFAPACTVALLDVHIRYLLMGNKFFKINAKGQRELLYNLDESQPRHQIWYMLEVGKGVDLLDQCSLFINLRSHSQATAFYESLGSCRLLVNNKEVKVHYGPGNTQFANPLQAALTQTAQDILSKMQQQALAAHAHKFLTIAGSVPVAFEGVPTHFPDLPSQLHKDLAQEKLVFVGIQLNRPFTQDVFDGISCAVNALPVLNLRLNKLQYKTQDWVNIVPLPSQGESFAGLSAIESSSGQPYTLQTGTGKRNPAEGEVLIRSHGIGKTSSREVKEMTLHLMETVRDQSAYFSEVNNEYLLTQLREIQTLLNRLEDKMINAEELVEDKTYLLLRPQAAGDNLQITYYTTTGNRAHQLRLHTPLQQYRHALTQPGTALLITTPVGGRNHVSQAERQLLLKQQLVNRNRIVSADDVKLAASIFFGQHLKQILVRPETRIAQESGIGFQRVIVVTIVVPAAQQNHDLSAEEMDYKCRSLLHYLREHSIIGLPFAIELQED
ncbi:MAG TPA: type VI secretion system baseplate subunit TssF [Phnomibacter sp.]|nr:type VI secretion system baseplate subunit TssF [Phnomibacter sp.]